MKLYLVCILQFSALLSFSQVNTAAIDSIFSEWNNSNSPGCALGVFEKGKIVYTKGYGSANLEYGIPNSSTSVFRIGSTSKQFTAACIVLLEQQGELKFSNTITDYFPDFPRYAKQITIRQLLNHTSGLRDYLTLSYLKGFDDNDFYTDEDIMKWMINQRELNFEPGDEFVYCNTGYWLLGQIVEEVSEMSMAEFAKQEIFKPLGMMNTHFHNDHTEIVPNRASGYQPNGDNGFSINMTTLDMIGDGGVFTTIEDIKRWDDSYYNSSVLNADFWKEMTRQGELNNDEVIDYASGLFVDEYEGLKTISHGGAFVGFRAELLRFPEQQVTIAIFANRADANPSRMAYEVADVLLSELFVADEGVETEEIPIMEEKIAKTSFVGEYEIQPGVVLIVSIVDDSLHVLQSWNKSEYSIERLNGNTFVHPESEDLSFRFTNLEEGFTELLQVNQIGGITECVRRVAFDDSDVKLSQFVGVFYSDELEVEYTVQLDDKTLELVIEQMDPINISPSGEDQFIGENGVVNFIREKEIITGFKLDAGRVKNLHFVKIESD